MFWFQKGLARVDPALRRKYLGYESSLVFERQTDLTVTQNKISMVIEASLPWHFFA